MSATYQGSEKLSSELIEVINRSIVPVSPIALVLVSGSTYRLMDGLGRVSEQTPLQIREIGGRRLSASQRANLAPADCPLPSQLVPPDSGLRPELAVMASPRLVVSGGVRDGRVLAAAEYALGAFDAAGNLPLTVSEFPASVAEVRAVPADVVSYPAAPVLTVSEFGQSWTLGTAERTNWQTRSYFPDTCQDGVWPAGWQAYVGVSAAPTFVAGEQAGMKAMRCVSSMAGAPRVFAGGQVPWVSGETLTISVRMRAAAGKILFVAPKYGNGSGEVGSATIGGASYVAVAATGAWQTVTIAGVSAAASATHVFATVGLTGASAGDTFDVEWVEYERGTSTPGRYIPTTTAAVTVRDLTSYSPATGAALLGATAPNLSADGVPCTGSGQSWQAPATVTSYPERALTAGERTYAPATGALTVSIPLKPGQPVRADGVECSGSGGSWTVPPLNTWQLVWADAPEGCQLTQTGPRAYTLTRPEAAPSSLLGSNALRWTADTRTGKSAWIAAPGITAGTVYKACLDVELDPGSALPNYDSRGPSYATDGIRIWISGVNPVFGVGEWIHLGENRYRLQVTGLSVQTPTGKVGIVRGGYSVLFKFSRWLVEVQETGEIVHYCHIPGGFQGADYVQAGSDVTLQHAIDSAPEAVWAAGT